MTATVATSKTAGTQINLAQWTEGMKRSLLRQMLAVVSRPGILSFAGGLPAPELFPSEAYAEASRAVLTDGAHSLQYGPPFEPLKAHIRELMALRGVEVSEAEIFITTGAQQGLNVATRLLLDANGQVMLEKLVYTGIQQVVAPYQPQLLTVSSDLEYGIDVNGVAEHLVAGAEPAFLYVIPEAHNPLGVSLSLERQQRLLELARLYRMPILEDDPYGLLQYDDSAVTPLRALDDEWVIYVGSFSKILAPALRLGWMIVPEPLRSHLTVAKEALDLETSGFIQRSVAALLDTGHFPTHLAQLRRAYRARRDAMLTALSQHFPATARWTRPSGGMFIWVELPRQVDTMALLWRAVEEINVAYIPGTAFAIEGDRTAKHCLRLNFSNASEEAITRGIAALGALLRTVC